MNAQQRQELQDYHRKMQEQLRGFSKAADFSEKLRISDETQKMASAYTDKLFEQGLTFVDDAYLTVEYNLNPNNFSGNRREDNALYSKAERIAMEIERTRALLEAALHQELQEYKVQVMQGRLRIERAREANNFPAMISAIDALQQAFQRFTSKLDKDGVTTGIDPYLSIRSDQSDMSATRRENNKLYHEQMNIVCDYEREGYKLGDELQNQNKGAGLK